MNASVLPGESSSASNSTSQRIRKPSKLCVEYEVKDFSFKVTNSLSKVTQKRPRDVVDNVISLKSSKNNATLPASSGLKKAKIVQSGPPATIALSVKEQKMDEQEEELIKKHIKKYTVLPLNKKMPSSFASSTFNDQKSAQMKCLSESTSVLLDWSSNGAKVIGNLCKVFWDGDGEWFDARILNFDPTTKKHFIYYFNDSTGEWIDFADEPIAVSSGIVLSKYSSGSIAWPALQFWLSDKAFTIMQSAKYYKKGGIYVEFWGANDHREFNFVREDMILPFSIDNMPKKATKVYERCVELARSELSAAEDVKQEIYRLIRTCGAKMLNDTRLVGTRVRAPAVMKIDKTNNKRYIETISASSFGRITHFCPSIERHFVVFDDESLQPYWLEHTNDSLEIVIEDADSSIQPNSDIDSSIIGKITFEESNECLLPQKDIAESLAVSSDLASHNMMRCLLCRNDCDDRLDYILKCTECNTCCHEGCFPEGGLRPVNTVGKLRPWQCWQCLRCSNCDRSIWFRNILQWNIRRKHPSGPDKPLSLCGWCLNHFKHKDDYCIICCKLFVYESGSDEEALSWDYGAWQKKAANALVSQTVTSTTILDERAERDRTMIQCNECDRWTHAMCEGIDDAQYNSISNGTHPVWGDEYLCSLCRVELSKVVITALQKLDKKGMFAYPVSETEAQNYYDIIRNPMDFFTMSGKSDRGAYKSMQSLRQDVELMCLNALIFNRQGDAFWLAAKYLFEHSQKIFDDNPRVTSITAFGVEAFDTIAKYSRNQSHQKPSSISNNTSSTKDRDKDSSAHSEVMKIDNETKEDAQEEVVFSIVLDTSPKEDPSSFMPSMVSIQNVEDAWYLSALDQCFTCGSAGTKEHMLYCIDCGEAFHSFCIGASIATMGEKYRDLWRCYNCKFCEICCHVTADDTDTLVMCELCDRAFHIFCVYPNLTSLPEFVWICADCVDCKECSDVKRLSNEVSPKSWSNTREVCWSCLPVSRPWIDSAKECKACMKICKSYLKCSDCTNFFHPNCISSVSPPLLKDCSLAICSDCSMTREAKYSSSLIGMGTFSAEIFNRITSIQSKRRQARYNDINGKRLDISSTALSLWANNFSSASLLIWGLVRLKLMGTNNTFCIEKISTVSSTDPLSSTRAVSRCRRFLALTRRRVRFGKSKQSNLLAVLERPYESIQALSVSSVQRLAILSCAFLDASDSYITAQWKQMELLCMIVELAFSIQRIELVYSKNFGKGNASRVPSVLQKVFTELSGVTFYRWSLPILDSFENFVKILDALKSLTESEKLLLRQCTLEAFGSLQGNLNFQPGLPTLFQRQAKVVAKCPEQSTSPANSREFSTVLNTIKHTRASFRASGISLTVSPEAKIEFPSQLRERALLQYREHLYRSTKLHPEFQSKASSQGEVLSDEQKSFLQTLGSIKEEISALLLYAVPDENTVSQQSLEETACSSLPLVPLVHSEAEIESELINIGSSLKEKLISSAQTVEVDSLSAKDSEDSMMREVAVKTQDLEKLAMSSKTLDSPDKETDNQVLGWPKFCSNEVDLGTTKSEVWIDPRQCHFCGEDGEDSVVGRLLPFFDGQFSHANCLCWSSSLHERKGVLYNSDTARNSKQVCSLCKRGGATLSCVHRGCHSVFHLRCALACSCSLLERVTFEVDNSLIEKREEVDKYGRLLLLMLCPGHHQQVDFFTNRGRYRQWKPRDPEKYLIAEALQPQLCESTAAGILAERRRDKVVRTGAVTIFTIGAAPLPPQPGFSSPCHIYPHRFRSSRIFWSMCKPWKRTVYFFEILSVADIEQYDLLQLNYIYESCQDAYISLNGPAGGDEQLPELEEGPIFRVVALDSLEKPIFAKSVEALHSIVLREVFLCQQLARESLGCRYRTNAPGSFPSFYGSTPHQFFALDIPLVRQAVEMTPESVACMISLHEPLRYLPRYCLPSAELIAESRKKLAEAKGVRSISASGCSRAESAETTANFMPRIITSILAKTASDGEYKAGESPGDGDNQRDDVEMAACLEKYIEMTRVYQRDSGAHIEIRRSGIHGWGLFTRVNIKRDDVLVEYIGEKIRQAVADRREAQYDRDGVGSCYLFRLDKSKIIDATFTGGMARFINHSCDPNAYARVICLSGETPGSTGAEEDEDKHIIIMAARDIQEGEEVTYDYKFPIEDKKLKCFCGSIKCSGSMN